MARGSRLAEFDSTQLLRLIYFASLQHEKGKCLAPKIKSKFSELRINRDIHTGNTGFFGINLLCSHEDRRFLRCDHLITNAVPFFFEILKQRNIS